MNYLRTLLYCRRRVKLAQYLDLAGDELWRPLAPAAKARWQRVLALLDWKLPALVPPAPIPPPLCPCCHKPMVLVGQLPRPPP